MDHTTDDLPLVGGKHVRPDLRIDDAKTLLFDLTACIYQTWTIRCCLILVVRHAVFLWQSGETAFSFGENNPQKIKKALESC
jgi:hypothetical protein